MQDQQDFALLPEIDVEAEPSSAFLTQCYRSALDRLDNTFQQRRPLAIIIGEGRSAASFVIGTFVSALHEDVAVARITEPCANANELMRLIISAAGFHPKDLNTDDLESIFSMFLAFQKSHSHRTVVCIEELQDSEWWVFDKIRKLVELEVEGQYGLMLVISGQPVLKELLNTRPLSAVCALAGPRISLSPFTLEETTEYIRRRVEAAGRKLIDQAFEYHAITLVHELCVGIPDAISTLVSQCIDIADEIGDERVTTAVVKSAYESLRAESVPLPFVDEPDQAATIAVDRVNVLASRLIVRLTNDEIRERVLRQGHVLIGRSILCDIRIESPIVSRHHALISYSDDGTATICDLSSTNGTQVNGWGIKEHQLASGDTISVGDCTIEYLVDEKHAIALHDAERVDLRPIIV
jgi:type II secretory pathway predicted ATPase ExeA